MKNILTSLLLILVVSCIATPVYAEENLVEAYQKEADAFIKELGKKFKFNVTYDLPDAKEFEMQFLSGFCSKTLKMFENDVRIDWKQKIKKMDGMSVTIAKAEGFEKTKEFNMGEPDSKAVIKFNPYKDNHENLILDLVREREKYLEYSEMVKKLKLNVVIGKDARWSDAGFFIRMMETLLKEDSKVKKRAKTFTFSIERKENLAVDYKTKMIPIIYNIPKAYFVQKLENCDAELDAYEESMKHIAALEAKGLKFQYHEQFSIAYYEKLWREILPVVKHMKKLVEVEVTLAKMIKKPIMFSPEATGEGEKFYTIYVGASTQDVDNLFAI